MSGKAGGARRGAPRGSRDLAAQVRTSAAALTPDELRAPVLVGVSGGADSLTLLHLLWRWRHEEGPALHVVHVDHGLRPESSGEAVQVRALCDDWQVPVTVVRVDTATIRAARRGGIEDAARTARYRAFAAVAGEIGARVLALGHQADDQAETVLLHLLRGAGLAGLGGMPAVRRAGAGFADSFIADEGEGDENGARLYPAVWRPLLATRREAIAAYCRHWGLAPVADLSNDDLRLRRNAIRHAILPALERHFPQATAVLARGAGLLADDEALLEEVVERRWQELARVEDGLVLLDRAAFRAEHRAVQRRIVRRAWAALRGSTAGLTAEPVELAREAIAASRTGARCALPRNVVVVLDRDTAAVGDAAGIDDTLRRRLGVPLIERGRVAPIGGPGTVALGGGWAIGVAAGGAAGACARWMVHIPLDTNEYAHSAPQTKNDWTLRSWQAGDRIVLRGGRGTQKVHDWFIDHHIPSYARRHLVLLACGARVVWIAGVASFVEWPSTDRDNEAGLTLRVLREGAAVTGPGRAGSLGAEGRDGGIPQAG